MQAIILSKVPNEIFSMIFEVGVENGRLDFLRSICLTCREWYNLAINTPNLWRFIHIMYDSSPDKVALWMERSCNRPLSIMLPTIQNYLLPNPAPENSGKVAMLLMQQIGRWQTFIFDCLYFTPAIRQARVQIIESDAAPLLETLVLKVSGDTLPGPSKCVLPRLRSLTLERMACHWAEIALKHTTKTLTSFALANVESSYSLSLDQILSGLRHCALLEELIMDEVTWDALPSTLTTITLPQLRTLSLTAVSDIDRLIQSIHLPNLVELVIGDVVGNLSSVFTHLSLHTFTIQSLTTGLWGDSCGLESESALVSLLIKQPHLRMLSVRNATISDILLRRFIVPSPSSSEGVDVVAPLLVKLELPSGGVTISTLVEVVKSRDELAGNEVSNNGGVRATRLQNLFILGEEMLDGDVMGELKRYVGKVEFELVSDEIGPSP